MLFKIQHITRYRYDRPVYESANQIKIYPLTDGRQEIVKQELNITGDQPIHVFTDYFGNTAGHFTLSEPHRELAIDSKLVVRTILPPETALDRSHPLEWEQFAAAVRGDVRLLDLSKAELKAAKNDIQRATDDVFRRSPLTVAELMEKIKQLSIIDLAALSNQIKAYGDDLLNDKKKK